MTLTLVLIVVSVAAGGDPDGEKAVQALENADPAVRWDDRAIVLAELTGDASKDGVFRGRTPDGGVAIGIVKGPIKANSQTWEIRIPVGRAGQDSLCAADVQITVEVPRPPLDGLGCGGRGPPAACSGLLAAVAWSKKKPEAVGLRIDDGKCDAFHVYWNPIMSKFDWWRL